VLRRYWRFCNTSQFLQIIKKNYQNIKKCSKQNKLLKKVRSQSQNSKFLVVLNGKDRSTSSIRKRDNRRAVVWILTNWNLFWPMLTCMKTDFKNINDLYGSKSKYHSKNIFQHKHLPDRLTGWRCFYISRISF